jgi:CBS domain-containing protein
VRADESLIKVIRLLATRGYGHALVVDDNNVILGVVSVKDIAKRILTAFELSGPLEGLNLQFLLQEQIHNIMSRPPIVLDSRRYDLCYAARIMTEKSIGVIPLVNSEGKLMNAVSELNYAFYLLDEDAQAINFATLNPFFGKKDDTLLEALGRMIESGFRRLPLRANSEILMSTMHGILLTIARKPSAETLLTKVSSVAQPAIILRDGASIGEAAEAILASSDRAVLLTGDKDRYAILTERDLVRAYYKLRC